VTDFERADRWMGRVCDWFRGRPPVTCLDMAPGPERVQRERAVRLLVLAGKRRDRAAALPVRNPVGARERVRARS
jgi:hypothetical protein